jgi:hypothetical protein
VLIITIKLIKIKIRVWVWIKGDVDSVKGTDSVQGVGGVCLKSLT